MISQCFYNTPLISGTVSSYILRIIFLQCKKIQASCRYSPILLAFKGIEEKEERMQTGDANSTRRTPRIIDFHSHVLPAIDDGSRSLEMTAEMLRESYRQKVRKLVATPHFYPEKMRIDDFLSRRSEAISSLSSVYTRQEMPLLYFGAEVAYFPGIAETENIRKLCILGTDTILVEMPFSRWSDYDMANILSLRTALALNVVIAHIERYLHYQKKGTLEYLVERGIYIQSNGENFLSFSSRREAMRLLSDGMIHVLGSDMHNTTSRAQNLGKARTEIMKKDGEERLSDILMTTKSLLDGALTYDDLTSSK